MTKAAYVFRIAVASLFLSVCTLVIYYEWSQRAEKSVAAEQRFEFSRRHGPQAK